MSSMVQHGTVLMPGIRVEPYGFIGAVGIIEGERYYWLHLEDGQSHTVSMMPADVVERLYSDQQAVDA